MRKYEKPEIKEDEIAIEDVIATSYKTSTIFGEEIGADDLYGGVKL